MAINNFEKFNGFTNEVKKQQKQTEEKKKKAEKYQLLLDKYKKMTYTKLKSLASKHGFKGKKSELAEKLAKLVLEDE